MTSETLIWSAAALLLALGSLVATCAPLLRGTARSERRASYDMQVYRDQLREIDSDRDRGVLSDGEAEASRIEISRRLLAAADAEASETGGARAPRRVSRVAAVALIAGLAVATAAIYARIGAPLLPDQPLAARLADRAIARAQRPGQAEIEALVAGQSGAAPPDAAAAPPEDLALLAQVQALLADRPDDLKGHRLLVTSFGGIERWAEAAAAQARVVEILGAQVTADDLVTWAHLMILATDGYVSPEAEAALSRALALDPAHPVGRYYSGHALLQAGRPDMTLRVWSQLLTEGPPNAPWVMAIDAEIDAVAEAAGQPPVPRPTRPRGPTDAEIEGAGAMAPDERQAMIEGMVAQLSERLAREGGPPRDWAQLVRSLGVLGRTEDAASVLAEARASFAEDPTAGPLLDAAAADAGLDP